MEKEGVPYRRPGAAGPTVTAPVDAEDLKKSAVPAPSAFLHNVTVCGLLALLVLTYSLESFAPTLDYVGRWIMLAVQLVHLLATAAYGLRADWVLVAALANMAAFTRFWRIEDPQSVIFDEVSCGMGRGLLAQSLSHATPSPCPFPLGAL